MRSLDDVFENGVDKIALDEKLTKEQKFKAIVNLAKKLGDAEIIRGAEIAYNKFLLGKVKNRIDARIRVLKEKRGIY